MCGIFGWVTTAGAKRHSRETLVRLTDLLSHRGPDGGGYVLFDSAGGECQVALGHRRLSIIDPAAGGQPMASLDGTVTVVFNGEIYNYIELAQELRQLGHMFRTRCDTEVLIEAYRAWGTDALQKLRGMFSFALWDANAQSLVVARDPFGKKPLFLSEQNGILIYSSEIAPLLEFPGAERDVEPTAVDHYLFGRYVPGPLTFFRGIKKLQPGCFAVWHKGILETTRYFIPPIGASEPDIHRFDDAVSLFEKSFDEAVRLRMRSDAPFGAFLSGGIDSSAVVAAMSKHSTQRVRTFSVGFRDARYSEVGYARSVARHLGTDHNELLIEPDTFMDAWPTAINHRAAPVSEPADIPIMMLSKVASSTVKMVLTGEGADELLGGYPKHRAEGWIALYQRLLPTWLHESLILSTIRALPYDMRRAKIVATVAGERSLPVRMRIWFGGLTISERNALLCRSGALEPPDPTPFSMISGSTARRTLFFDQTSWLPDNLLERGDRMMMAGSIEGRMPFMDTILANTVARFPDRFLIGTRGGKMVLRAAMRNSLPSQILTRKKVGFRVPIGEWLCGDYRGLLLDALSSRESRVAAFLDATIVRRLLDEHICRRQNHERVLWSLINLELFLRAFKLNYCPPRPVGR